MHNILFDPIFLIVPEQTASSNEVQAWFEMLDIWARAIDAPQNWYHLRDQVLEHLGYERFPSFQRLRTMQRRYHLDITLQGIARLVNTIFLQDAQSFRQALEAHLLDYGLIVEPSLYTIVLQPSSFAQQWPGELNAAVIHLVAEAGAAKSQGEPFSTNIKIATTEHSIIEHELRITGETTILSGDKAEHTSFSAIFPLVFEPEESVTTDTLTLWSQSEQGVIIAFERQFSQNWATTVTSPLSFTLGPRFLTSVRERRADTNTIVLSKIIYTAAAVIANQAKNIDCELHPLRETEAANSPQRTRTKDGAKAWRLMLTNKGVGWRMHYWHIPGPSGGSIEFSNILRKHDPEIIF